MYIFRKVDIGQEYRWGKQEHKVEEGSGCASKK